MSRILFQFKNLSEIPRNHAAFAEGIVIDHRKDIVPSPTQFPTHFFPVIRFTTAGGQVVQFQSIVGYVLGSKRYRIGDSVRVVYDLRDPSHAEIESQSPRFWLAFFVSGVALMLAIFLFMLIR